MNWFRIRAIIKKDISAITARKSLWMPLILVPFILCLILPCVMLLLSIKLGGKAPIHNSGSIDKLFKLYTIPAEFITSDQKFVYVFMNYAFIPMFMILPVMTSSIIAAYSISGEKEKKTLETLLYTPVSNKELLTAKLLAAFIPAIVITVVSFGTYFCVGNIISLIYLKTMIIRSFIWIPAILMLSPAISLLTLSLNLIISLRAKSSQESQQLSGLIVLPLVFLLISQLQGLLVLNTFYLILFSLILFLLSMVIINKIAPRFDRESIINTL